MLQSTSNHPDIQVSSMPLQEQELADSEWMPPAPQRRDSKSVLELLQSSLASFEDADFFLDESQDLTSSAEYAESNKQSSVPEWQNQQDYQQPWTGAHNTQSSSHQVSPSGNLPRIRDRFAFPQDSSNNHYWNNNSCATAKPGSEQQEPREFDFQAFEPNAYYAGGAPVPPPFPNQRYVSDDEEQSRGFDEYGNAAYNLSPSYSSDSASAGAEPRAMLSSSVGEALEADWRYNNQRRQNNRHHSHPTKQEYGQRYPTKGFSEAPFAYGYPPQFYAPESHWGATPSTRKHNTKVSPRRVSQFKEAARRQPKPSSKATASSESCTPSSVTSNDTFSSIPSTTATTTTCRGQTFAPLRPLSAYNYFFRAERDRLLGEESEDSMVLDEDFRKALLIRHWGQDRTTKRVHRKTHGKISFAELSKCISSRWKALGKEDREFYKRTAAMDMDRYKGEVEQQQNTTATATAH